MSRREAEFSEVRTGPGEKKRIAVQLRNHEQDWQPYIRLMPNLLYVMAIHIFIADSSWVWRTSRLTRERTAETVSRDLIPRREQAQGNLHFPCSADLEQDWQQFSYSIIRDDHTYVRTYIHTYIHAANSNIVEINKEAGGGAQGTLSLSKNCTSRESVSPLSRLIRGFRNKYH